MLDLSIAVISILISIFTLIILFIQYRINSPKLEFSYDIMCENDHTKYYVRIYLINTGRRPLFIKSVGIFDWSQGSYIYGENKKVEKMLNEAEMFYVDEPVEYNSLWKIGKIFAIDHTGKSWETTNKQMWFMYYMSHYDGVDKKTSQKLEKYSIKRINKSYKKYCKTINKIGKKPKTF